MQRKTDQREAIKQIMRETERPLTPHEVLEAAQSLVPGMGIATVYRNLKALQETSFLRTVELPGEPARYELAGLAHHHHFHCDGCARVFDMPGCPGDLERAVPDSFRIRNHEILYYGWCPECEPVT